MMTERTPLLSKSVREEPGFLSVLDGVLILPALLLNMFLAAFESTIAASTQSAVGSEFLATRSIAWLAISYLVVSTAVQPLYGRASDLFGRTRVYVFSLVFFAIGCLGCGLSTSMTQMIVARAVCGVGGGGLITISQVCAWDLLALRHRPLYQALNNVTYGVGAAVGAALGGLISDSIGWRWGYLVPVPVSIFSIAVFLARARPKLARLREAEKTEVAGGVIDWLGSALLMATITLLMLLVNLGGSIISWTSIVIPILSVTTCLAATLFYFHEVRFPLPVLPLHLLNSRHMASQVGLNLFGAMTVFGTLFLIPVYFQTVLLTTASIASRRLLYPTLTAPLGSICTGLCLHRWHDGHRWFQRVGSAVLLAGATTMFYMTFEQDHGRSELWYICRLVWVHLGMGMLFISSLLDILTRAGAEHAAASSLIFLIRSVGTVLGIAGSQSVLQNVLLVRLRHAVTGPDAERIISGVRDSVEYVRQLKPELQAVVIGCYRSSFRASLGALIGVAALAVASALLGVRSHDVQAGRVDEEIEEACA